MQIIHIAAAVVVAVYGGENCIAKNTMQERDKKNATAERTNTNKKKRNKAFYY